MTNNLDEKLLKFRYLLTNWEILLKFVVKV